IIVNSLEVGDHSITAIYQGDGTFESSTSDPLTQTVLANQVEVSLTSSSNPAEFGEMVTFTAVVAPSGGTPLTNPTGWVHFYSDGFYIGSAEIINGSATFDTDELDV